jgi:sporulation protein YlmC with PRC-barrel domain
MKWIKTCAVALSVGSLLFASMSFAQDKDRVEKDRMDKDRVINQRERAVTHPGDTTHRGFSANMFRASKLIGADVENPQGEDLGDIKDVVFDAQGDIRYAVLAFGGFLGLGEKYFAVPWAALKPEAGQKPGDTERYVLNIDKERLKSAPGFDRDKWPNMADRSWGEQVYAFYGVTPYWHERAADMRAADPSMMRMAPAATVAATVQHVDQNTKLIRIRTTDNAIVEMQAPASLVSTLQDGDRVEVVIRKQDGAMSPATGQPSTAPARPGQPVTR